LRITQTLNKFGRHAKAVAVLVFVATAVLHMVGCNSSKGEGSGEDGFITVGAIVPLSNDFSVAGPSSATWGIHSTFGVLVAKETINQGDGVLGKKLDLVILDGQGNQKIALQRYDEHKNSEVFAIIGPPIGKLATIMYDKAKNDGMPFLMQQGSPQQVAARKEYYREHTAIKNLSETYYVNFGYEPPPAATAACECVLMLADAMKLTRGASKTELISAIDIIDQTILLNFENSKN